MEMWYNGEQASGATIAVGATTLRAAEQASEGFHHIGLPRTPLLSSHSFDPVPLHGTKTLCSSKNFNVVPF